MHHRAIIAILGLFLFPWLGEAYGQGKPPNVLFIAIDDLNDWVGFMQGHPQVKTPNLDRLARRGVVFANAHCAAPLCCPSRAALFSGRQPFRTGVYTNDANIHKLLPGAVLLQQHLAQNGYQVLGAGKLLHHASADVYHKYFGPEQRWSPLASAKAAAYTKEELPAKPTRPRHVARYGAHKKEVVLPLNRMPSDRNPKGAAGESFDWGPFDVGDDDMGDGRITSWALPAAWAKAARALLPGRRLLSPAHSVVGAAALLRSLSRGVHHPAQGARNGP